ncbi:hypothetical protein [Actinoplanes subglobosus]|uniref:Uncharacterized protein n=1 Tax=Actinoplanes subglobosus TaxID=1547892 RepID=A0ABV8J0E0_9ACTN
MSAAASSSAASAGAAALRAVTGCVPVVRWRRFADRPPRPVFFTRPPRRGGSRHTGTSWQGGGEQR